MEVVVRQVVATDLPRFFVFQSDHGASRMAAVPTRDRDAFDAHWARILADDEVTARTIVVGGAVAGNILAFPHEDVVEVGYWLGREFWGKGLATRALTTFLSEVTHRPLYAAAARENLASIRVLEKCGFALTGYRPEPDPAGGEIEMAFFELL